MSEAEYRLDNYRPAHWRYVVREGGTRAVTDGKTETVITLSHAVWAADTLVSLFVGSPVADLAHQLEAEDRIEGENIVRGQPVMSAAIPEALAVPLAQIQGSMNSPARSIQTLRQGLELFHAWQQAGLTPSAVSALTRKPTSPPGTKQPP